MFLICSYAWSTESSLLEASLPIAASNLGNRARLQASIVMIKVAYHPIKPSKEGLVQAADGLGLAGRLSDKIALPQGHGAAFVAGGASADCRPLRILRDMRGWSASAACQRNS